MSVGHAHSSSPERDAHALVMGIAFVLMVTTALLGRYAKTRIARWFLFHQLSATFTLILSIIGLVLAITFIRKAGSGHLHSLHSQLATAALVLLLLQAVGGALRPVKSTADDIVSPKRVLWGKLHLLNGALVCVLFAIAVVTGASAYGASTAAKTVIFGFIGVVFVIVASLEGVAKWKAQPAQTT